MLCVLVLSVAPRLVEPDDSAYRASIVAMTEGHFLTLSGAQVQALAQALGAPGGHGPAGGRILGGLGVIPQWVQLSDGRWISEKDPGYPFLAAPFQALGIIRWATLFYGTLACAGLFAGARRWLGRFGGAAAVGLYCSSGSALLFAWRDYMPTFTDASLIAAGSGALLWAVLADEASGRRRTWAGLAGFVMLEAATFTRYTDIVVLGCAAVGVLAVWWRGAARLPFSAVGWWLASVAVFGAGVAVFDGLVYGGPLTTGYRPGEISFGLGAIAPNLRYMPAHLLQAIPVLLLGLVSLDRALAPATEIFRRHRIRGAPRPVGWPGPGRVVVRGLGPVRRVLLDGPSLRHDVAVRQVLRTGARGHLAAGRLAGDADSRPGLGGRPDIGHRHRDDVRPWSVVLPRHDGHRDRRNHQDCPGQQAGASPGPARIRCPAGARVDLPG